MKLLDLQIENYKTIEAMYLHLDGKSVRVAGTTGQGKTTAMSALWEIMETVGDPIRHAGKAPGAVAKLRLLIGNDQKRVIAERTYTAGDTKITITSEDKKTKISAKEFRSWVSSLAVNPHQIMAMGPKDQTETLLRAAEVPEGVDLVAIDAARLVAHNEREDAKKDRTRLQAAHGIRPREVQPVKTQEILDELDRRRSEATSSTQERERLAAEIARTETEHADLLRKVAECATRLDNTQTELQDLDVWVSTNVDLDRIAKLSNDLARADEINEEAKVFTAWQETEKALTEAEAKVTAADTTVKDLDAQKRAAVESIKWPLPGLSVVDAVIHYKGIPLAQAGESEKLLVCGALAAHEIGNSVLRVVRIDGVESMSAEDFAALSEIFEEKGIQVLSTRVTRGDLEDGEILIHEGRVVPT